MPSGLLSPTTTTATAVIPLPTSTAVLNCSSALPHLESAASVDLPIGLVLYLGDIAHSAPFLP